MSVEALRLEPLLHGLKIRTKESTVVPLNLKWAQRAVVQEFQQAQDERRPCRIIILKARRLGVSTVCEALLFLQALKPNTNSCVVAHQRGPAETLFNMTKFYYESFDFKDLWRTKYATRREITFKDIGSSIWVESAENEEAGRGRTIQHLHASEVAFWTNPTDTMLSLNQCVPAIPGTSILIESTANGIGNWYEETWVEAQAGKNDYVPLFFPWWKEPDLIPCQGARCLDGSCSVCTAACAGLRLDSDEKRLRRLGADDAHIAWRRWAIPNRAFGSIDLFHQEYPAEPEEAFLVSGVNAFPEPNLKACFEPLTPAVGYLQIDETKEGKVRFVDDRRGPLRMYRRPSSDLNWGNYFIGADPSFGNPDGDYAAAQVINRQNNEQVAVWQGKINPIAFANELAKLGAFYNKAMIAPEVEGPGLATISTLVRIYPRIWQHRLYDHQRGSDVSSVSLGWSSSWKRKQMIIMRLADRFERQQLVLHDAPTYRELRGYTFYGSKGYGDMFGPGSDDAHDDLVMALAICVQCSSDETAPQPYEMRPQVGPSGLIMPEKSEMLPDEWLA